MTDARAGLHLGLREALAAAGVQGAPEVLDLERPRDPRHGDWSSNIALVAAGTAGMAPRQLAEKIAAHLNADPPPHVEIVEVAGPGFVNFHLAPSWLHDALRNVISEDVANYARCDVGRGRTVSVEYVSANPTGPLHAGHGRWAVFGDSLCRLLQRCGYRVVREYYLNDRGSQIDLFAESLLARSEGREPPDDGYFGEYVTAWAAQMPEGAEPRSWGLQRARRDHRETLDAMNVEFDVVTSESELVARGAMDGALEELRATDAVANAVSDTVADMVYEYEGAVWLRTSAFGDDSDRVLIKSDGEPTYFLPDIAYHREKLDRAHLVIDILGADHHGYTSRMRAALVALGHDPAAYEALIGQNVMLRRGGAKVRLAKRSGTMVTVSDLLDEVGSDVTRLVYLLQSIDSTQTIDVAVVSAQSAENPVYYLQYANARIHSLGRQAQARRGVQRAPLKQADLSLLTHNRELDVLRALVMLPDVVLAAMRSRAPHHITTWSRELAGAFHGFWHDCPILRDDTDDRLRQARLWLVEATRVGLVVALGILGVSAPERL